MVWSHSVCKLFSCFSRFIILASKLLIVEVNSYLTSIFSLMCAFFSSISLSLADNFCVSSANSCSFSNNSCVNFSLFCSNVSCFTIFCCFSCSNSCIRTFASSISCLYCSSFFWLLAILSSASPIAEFSFSFSFSPSNPICCIFSICSIKESNCCCNSSFFVRICPIFWSDSSFWVVKISSSCSTCFSFS